MKRNSSPIIPALPEVKLSEAIKAIKNGLAGSWPRRSVLVATKTLFRMPRSKLKMVRQYGSTLRIAAIAAHSEDFTLTNPVLHGDFLNS